MRFYQLFGLFLLFSCHEKKWVPNLPTKRNENKLIKTYVQPAQGYSQAVGVEFNGIKTIYISGQVGIGASFEHQLKDAFTKLLIVLDSSGATFKDVVKYNTYIVNYQPQHLDTFRTIRKKLFGEKYMPASTLVGVEALAKPEWGVEIEATAIIETLGSRQ